VSKQVNFPILKLSKSDKRVVDQPLGRSYLLSDKRYKNYTKSVSDIILEQVRSGRLIEDIVWPKFIIECEGKRYHYGELYTNGIKSGFLENLYRLLYVEHRLEVEKKRLEEHTQKRHETGVFSRRDHCEVCHCTRFI
jgi:hypothetical protein